MSKYRVANALAWFLVDLYCCRVKTFYINISAVQINAAKTLHA